MIYSTNKYGTPIFREMMLYLEERYQSTFYGYCNGDLLFDSSVIQLLDYTNKQIQDHLLFNRVIVLIQLLNRHSWWVDEQIYLLHFLP